MWILAAIYIGDSHNYRVRKVNAATGIITTIAGNGLLANTGDGGPATAASLESPLTLTMDNAGNLYISSDGKIRMIDSATGIISTFAGNGSSIGIGVDSIGDGGPATAAMIAPYGMCFDTCGNLYFTDEGCRIRAITATLPVDSALCGFNYAVVTKVNEVAANYGNLLVYPNPNYGAFTINISSVINLAYRQAGEQAQIIVTNIVGQKIKELSAVTNKDVELQLNAPAGMYFVSVITSNGRWSKKVVVE
jgi:hypothetical protein